MPLIEKAKEILNVSLLAYKEEEKLINYPNFPPLFEKECDIQGNQNKSYGYYSEEKIVGVIELAQKNQTNWIQRLVVHPDYFKEGIGTGLVKGTSNNCFLRQNIHHKLLILLSQALGKMYF